jgi:predicted AlkP superfamily phosphohydrolase/phosphomutase
MTSPTKILVIGLDAAEPSLLEGWSASGHLPALHAFGGTALHARTENAPGIYTGAVWPSLSTALSPGRHGRYYYRQIRTGTYDVVPFPADEVHGEPFWQVLARAGRRCAIVDVPKSPLGEIGDGLQICDWAAHDPENPPASRPEAMMRSVIERFGADPVGACDLHDAGAESLARLRDRLTARARAKAALSAELLARGDWDLFLTVFAESHCAGHHFWHVHDPRHPDHDAAVAAALGDPLRDVYSALDAAIGSLVAQAGPDTTVVVLTSHGMGAHYDGTSLLDEVLRRIDGVAAPRRSAAVEHARRLWRRTPASVRRPIQGLADRFYHAATSAVPDGRRFFAVPTNDNCGGIRLNLAGREPNGIVRRGADEDAACAELAKELSALVEAESGRPVVREVLRTRDVFSGEHLDDLPDVLVRWHRDAPIDGVTSARVGRIRGAHVGNRTGDHRAAGALWVRRPGLAPGPHPPVSVLDVAPTIATLLGVALPDVDGRPIAAVVG